MSINSRLRRTAKKRNARKEAPKAPSAPIEPHAELRDQQGQLLAGIVRQDGEWVLGLGGQIAGGSDSAAHVLAMIKRAARLHEAHGTPVRLKFSDALKAAALGEVEALGKSFEAFEAELESSMAAAKS
jgi:HAMP domain-containing protein